MPIEVLPRGEKLSSADPFRASVHASAPLLPALTSIRFLFALGVVLFHYQVEMLAPGQPAIPLLERARLGVDMFFVLSGFILAHVYGRQVREGRYSHRRFLIARLARIYPTHLLVLVIMGLAGLAALLLRQPFDPARYNLVGWLADLVLVQAWVPMIPPPEWNGPAWSLSAEWGAYIAFPVFAWIGLKPGRKPWLPLLAAVTIFVALDLAYQRWFGLIVTQADSIMGLMRIPGEFLFGIALQQLWRRIELTRAQAILASLASGLALLTAMQLQIDERATVALTGPLILSLAWLSQTGRVPVLDHPLALRAGEVSYAVYVVHFPIIVIWKNAMALLTGLDSSYRLAFWEAGVLLVITLSAAFVIHAAWETPARGWIRSRIGGLTP